jgi:maleylacetoacetate isomerase
MNFELYSFWRTSATFRVRVALNLKGLQAVEHDVDLVAGQQRSADFLAINPMGAIPALIDKRPGQSPAPLTQSTAILEFLEEAYPAPALLPVDLHERARVRSLCAMLTADTHPLMPPRVKKYLTSVSGFDEAAWRAWQTHWLTTGLTAFEQRISTDRASADYCHGSQVGMADICLASVVMIARVFKLDLPAMPTVDAVMQRCDQLPAFARAAPHLQQGAPKL